MTTVLIVEDEMNVREALAQTLELADLSPIPTGSFVAAKDLITRDFPGVILSDIRMPGKDGMHLLDYAHRVDPELPVILLTGEGDIPMAVNAMDRGAFDFLEKPCSNETLIDRIKRAAKSRDLIMENRRLKQEMTRGDAAARMLYGNSARANILREQTRHMARIDSPVLVYGPPGSGVSKVAEVVYLLSSRSDRAFSKLSAPATNETVLADAIAAHDDGTIFIDEVGRLDPACQFSLLEHLDNGRGARILAGSTQSLDELTRTGGFNTDLFYRLETMQLRIPALSERPEDIPVLFKHYVSQAAEQAGLEAPDISDDVIAALMARDWPGNARSLMNVAMRFAFGLGLAEEADDTDLGLAEKMAQVERSLIATALERHKGNASETARSLKLPRKTFYDKLTRHGLRAEDYR